MPIVDVGEDPDVLVTCETGGGTDEVSPLLTTTTSPFVVVGALVSSSCAGGGFAGASGFDAFKLCNGICLTFVSVPTRYDAVTYVVDLFDCSLLFFLSTDNTVPHNQVFDKAAPKIRLLSLETASAFAQTAPPITCRVSDEAMVNNNVSKQQENSRKTAEKRHCQSFLPSEIHRKLWEFLSEILRRLGMVHTFKTKANG
jgi:hypothetical protein